MIVVKVLHSDGSGIDHTSSFLGYSQGTSNDRLNLSFRHDGLLRGVTPHLPTLYGIPDLTRAYTTAQS